MRLPGRCRKPFVRSVRRHVMGAAKCHMTCAVTRARDEVNWAAEGKENRPACASGRLWVGRSASLIGGDECSGQPLIVGALRRQQPGAPQRSWGHRRICGVLSCKGCLNLLPVDNEHTGNRRDYTAPRRIQAFRFCKESRAGIGGPAAVSTSPTGPRAGTAPGSSRPRCT